MVARVCREYLKFLVKYFQKQIEYLDSLRKNTQIEKKNQSNQSSDEGDIIDLKSTLFLGNFVTTRKLQCARVRKGKKAKGNKSQGEEGKRDLSKVKCFHFHEYGNYATGCP